MALIAIWKNPTKKGTQCYRVKGTAEELEEYVINNGDLTVFEDDDENKPLYYSSRLTKSGKLTWNEELERYDIEISFESEVLKQAAMRSYNTDSATTSKSSSDSDEETADDAEIEEKAPVKKKTGILQKRKKTS